MTRLNASHLTSVDWRTIPADRMASLYAAETDRWTSALDWDTAKSWEEVERGRQLGTLSGLAIVNDAGSIAGWSYYSVQNGLLQVGAFVSDSEAAAQALLHALLNDDILASVSAVTLFVFADAPGLAAAMRLKGLSVDRYWYLSRDLERTAPPRVADVRQWRPEDVQATAALLARAYEGRDEARPFAPHGTAEEWVDYVTRLSQGHGCGTLVPQACICVPDGPNRLLGVALVTRLGENTAHLAQLAVDPQAQGNRLGKQLLELSCSATTLAGPLQITLFVSGRNGRARSLYEQSQFAIKGNFLAAGTLQPRRSTSVAPGNVVMTRR